MPRNRELGAGEYLFPKLVFETVSDISTDATNRENRSP